MAGIMNLNELLSSMAPRLRDGEYVFCSMKDARYGDFQELEPLAAFNESEGLTLVVPKHRADDHGLHYGSVFKCITLTVHSSLDAVGLTAAFATKLAEYGISANVIAAYHHDHIFVQSERADQAITALCELTRATD